MFNISQKVIRIYYLCVVTSPMSKEYYSYIFLNHKQQ